MLGPADVSHLNVPGRQPPTTSPAVACQRLASKVAEQLPSRPPQGTAALIARGLHTRGGRAEQAAVVVPCASPCTAPRRLAGHWLPAIGPHLVLPARDGCSKEPSPSWQAVLPTQLAPPEQEYGVQGGRLCA